jgi:hypothetical protein
MRPRQDLVSAGYCLADEGTSYLVYLPTGGEVNVALDGKTYETLWIDAARTSQRYPAGTVSVGKGLAPPLNSQDWLLYLTATTRSANRDI